MEIKANPNHVCFKCGHKMESALQGEEFFWDAAADGVVFHGGGSYGSMAYDSVVNDIGVNLVVCDECLKKNKNRLQEIKINFKELNKMLKNKEKSHE